MEIVANTLATSSMGRGLMPGFDFLYCKWFEMKITLTAVKDKVTFPVVDDLNRIANRVANRNRSYKLPSSLTVLLSLLGTPVTPQIGAIGEKDVS